MVELYKFAIKYLNILKRKIQFRKEKDEI